MANIGSALTGQKDPADDPLQSIVTGAASSPAYQAVLGDPASRAALLQIGLNMMQPQAIGQLTIGHIGQALGSGGEEVSRTEKADLEEEQARTKMEQSQQALDIKRQEAGSYDVASRALAARAGNYDRMALEQLRQQGRRDLLGQKNYAQHAHETAKLVNDIAFDPTRPENAPLLKYRGKDSSEIETMMRLNDAAAGGGGGSVPVPSGGKPQPSPEDVAYARAHPEVVEKFIARFGVSP